MRRRQTTPVSPPVSPVVVRSTTSDPEARAAAFERELEPVITIMHGAGLAAAGFQVTGPWEADIDRKSLDGSLDRAARERLMLARDAIRDMARERGVFWTLPDAILHYRGLAVELFGDQPPGTPRDRISYSSVSLVTAELAAGKES